MKFSNKQELIEHLYSLPVLHPKNDLSYIKKILQEFDNPQDKVKTIHVTGTNGKGSTSYYLSNLLKKASKKTGLFVSPYVREFNERIQLNGENISDQDLVALANQIELKIAQIKRLDPDFSLVTFEYETLLAFLYFAKSHCDYAVIEVGIGGEHDKTNVINPQVSVITTVGLDHEKIIGPTLTDIAREKSGIIKKNRPVVLGNVPESVLPVIKEKAKKEQACVYQLGRDFFIDRQEKINYHFADHSLKVNLRPAVESYDIAISLTAFYLLGLELADSEIEDAINQTQIPGRYQVLHAKPRVILDGAHNIQAMQNLLDFVHRTLSANGQLYVLIAMMKDKDLSQVFSLFSNQDQVYLTRIPYPRAAKLADFPVEVQKRYPYHEDYATQYHKLLSIMNKNDTLLVTGSFYLVSAILNLEDKDESSWD